MADETRRVLRALARGYRVAAERPEEASAMFQEQAEADHPELAGQGHFDAEMLKESFKEVAPNLLDPSGEWGRMDGEVWRSFLDFLSDEGMLTSKLPSRDPDGKATAPLDHLRGGEGGKTIPRHEVHHDALFTNELLA